MRCLGGGGSHSACTLRPSSLHRHIGTQAKKGKKGAGGEAPAADDGAARQGRRKALQKAGLADEEPQKRSRRRSAPSTTAFADEGEASGNEDERDDQFESRLSQLAASSATKQQDQAQTQAQSQPDVPLSSGAAYADPPSLLDTMRGQGAKKEGDDQKVNPFGTGAVGLLATAVIVAALVIGALGLDNGNTAQPPQTQLTDDASQEIQRTLKEYETELQTNPNNEEALEGAGVLNAELGNFAEAGRLLSRFTAVNSKDPQAWRLLAEVRSKLGEKTAAVAAYKEAYANAEADIKVLKGYAEALVAAARPADAVRVVEGAKGVARKAVQQRGPDGISEDGASLSPIEVDLLVAKVYSQWRGHTGDAFTVYDRVIQDHQDDFRGYLAKGVLLRKEGRKGEAERVFLQARYLAPKNMRSIVDRIAQPQP